MVACALPQLQGTCKSYSLHDIFNANETRVNYCMPSGRTISFSVMSGGLKYKKRLTVRITLTYQGARKFIFFIGSFVKHRCFQKLSDMDLQFYD